MPDPAPHEPRLRAVARLTEDEQHQVDHLLHGVVRQAESSGAVTQSFIRDAHSTIEQIMSRRADHFLTRAAAAIEEEIDEIIADRNDLVTDGSRLTSTNILHLLRELHHQHLGEGAAFLSADIGDDPVGTPGPGPS